GFDQLDPTKLIPEELVPVKLIGKMTLNRNPDNFFAETEQVAFHPGHIVPGIDFTNDPLLQGRLFSYTDTQISRLGGANFHEIPINRPVCPFHNNQRDGMHRQTINVGQASYEPNSVSDGWPKETPPADGGFESYQERVDGTKIRVRSDSFSDHFSQATLFYNSMSEPEKGHIAAAYTFELGKVTKPEIRERVVNEILANIDAGLASQVALALGLPAPKAGAKPGHAKPAASPALSLLNRVVPGIKTRKIALLTAPGADEAALKALRDAFAKEGAAALVIAPSLAPIGAITPDATISGMPSIMFDAVFIPGGKAAAEALAQSGDARHFVLEAFKHLKAIGATGSGRDVLAAAQLPGQADGLCTGDDADQKSVLAKFIEAAGQHRVWSREAMAASIPA
ncbi:MAG TPA: catalase, partial [Paraburkholderia sp.]